MIVDGITVVRELEEENKQGANFVVSSMKSFRIIMIYFTIRHILQHG